jgi:UDP-glucose 4-epimerase
MRFLVTGCAGFIGSHLVDRLLNEGHEVLGVDNFSTGRAEFIAPAKVNPRFKFFEVDLLNPDVIEGILSAGIDRVFHLAANADVRDGLKHPQKDFEQNTLVTINVLEAMRKTGVKRIIFSSTGSVYGEAPVIPTPENCPFPVQTSLYGASKIAAEGAISSYVEGYGFQAVVLRFVSVLGERYSHGHVIDFVRQLLVKPDELIVLGDGRQRKSYIHVADCVEGILQAHRRTWPKRFEVVNLGTDEFITVFQSIEAISREMRLQPRVLFGGGDRGWPGDNPFILLDCSKMRATGWKTTISIRDAVQMTTRFLMKNRWLMEERKSS